MIKALRILAITAIVAVSAAYAWAYRPVQPAPWTADDKKLLGSLWIGNLGAPAADTSNSVADNPDAVILGRLLFFDTRFSANGEVSCESCHQMGRTFTDGLPKGRGIGEAKRNTPSVVGATYSPWQFWDGRKDSLWSQALGPLEDPNEHGSNRARIVKLFADDPIYRKSYETLFGPIPDLTNETRFPEDASPIGGAKLQNAWHAMDTADRHTVDIVFTNIGKAIAAYERTLKPEPTRFDAYVDAVLSGDDERQRALFDKQEILGLQLFIDKARCTECHNGPLLSNNEFHNTGILTVPGELPDRGRVNGVRELLEDPFNCLGEFNDDPDPSCAELTFVRTGPELIGAMKTPSLRNLPMSSPFMHKGQLGTLADVLDHYNRAPDAMIGHNEAEPLSLSRPELARLEAFLLTLSSD